MTKSEASRLVLRLMACFPGMQFPEGTVVAYEHYLGPLDHERATQAVDHLVQTSKFLPSVAEIFAAYEALAPRKPETNYRLFRPARVDGAMPASELKEAIAKALEAMK